MFFSLTQRSVGQISEINIRHFWQYHKWAGYICGNYCNWEISGKLWEKEGAQKLSYFFTGVSTEMKPSNANGNSVQ